MLRCCLAWDHLRKRWITENDNYHEQTQVCAAIGFCASDWTPITGIKVTATWDYQYSAQFRWMFPCDVILPGGVPSIGHVTGTITTAMGDDDWEDVGEELQGFFRCLPFCLRLDVDGWMFTMTELPELASPSTSSRYSIAWWSHDLPQPHSWERCPWPSAPTMRYFMFIYYIKQNALPSRLTGNDTPARRIPVHRSAGSLTPTHR